MDVKSLREVVAEAMHPTRCRMCGGGIEEGAMVGDVHLLCIPPEIRRRGRESIVAFVDREALPPGFGVGR